MILRLVMSQESVEVMVMAGNAGGTFVYCTWVRLRNLLTTCSRVFRIRECTVQSRAIITVSRSASNEQKQ